MIILNESHINSKLIQYYKNTPAIKYKCGTEIDYNISPKFINNIDNELFYYIAYNYHKLCLLYALLLTKEQTKKILHDNIDANTLEYIYGKLSKLKSIDIPEEQYAILVKNIRNTLNTLISNLKSLSKPDKHIIRDYSHSGDLDSILMNTRDSDIHEYNNSSLLKVIEKTIVINNLDEPNNVYIGVDKNTNTILYIIEQRFTAGFLTLYIKVFPTIYTDKIEDYYINGILVNNILLNNKLEVPIMTLKYGNISNIFSKISFLTTLHSYVHEVPIEHYTEASKAFSIIRTTYVSDIFLTNNNDVYEDQNLIDILNTLPNNAITIYVLKYTQKSYSMPNKYLITLKHPTDIINAIENNNFPKFYELFKLTLYNNDYQKINYIIGKISNKNIIKESKILNDYFRDFILQIINKFYYKYLSCDNKKFNFNIKLLVNLFQKKILELISIFGVNKLYLSKLKYYETAVETIYKLLEIYYQQLCRFV